MISIQHPVFIVDYVKRKKAKGLKIGFVPTMGALHKGHLELINQSASNSDITICSIFVNPTQFNDPGDYQKYPKLLEKDIHELSRTKADVLFVPAVEFIYADGTNNLEQYDLGYLQTILEGQFRPGHFQGVSQVMNRLLKIVTPDYLFMGQKDYQQCMVVNKLISLSNLDVQLITCPTIRENDGLAMSSRNVRLTNEYRMKAPLIYQVLMDIKNKLAPGNLNYLTKNAFDHLGTNGFKVEYVSIANASTLIPVDEWNGSDPLIALVAAFAGEVRLIDNMLLNT